MYVCDVGEEVGAEMVSMDYKAGENSKDPSVSSHIAGIDNPAFILV